MESLNTQMVCTTFNSLPTIFNSGGSFKLEVPQSTVQITKPLSYKFRVAEFVNENDQVVKVGLQVAVFEHDNYGVRQLRQDWTDVERVRLPFVA
jgi:hypothetical protein